MTGQCRDLSTLKLQVLESLSDVSEVHDYGNERDEYARNTLTDSVRRDLHNKLRVTLILEPER